jgi:hypothetical protein
MVLARGCSKLRIEVELDLGSTERGRLGARRLLAAVLAFCCILNLTSFYSAALLRLLPPAAEAATRRARPSKRVDIRSRRCSPLCSANLTSFPSLDSPEHPYAHTATHTRFTPCAVASLPSQSLLSRWQPPFPPSPRSRLLLLDPAIRIALEVIVSQNGTSIQRG